MRQRNNYPEKVEFTEDGEYQLDDYDGLVLNFGRATFQHKPRRSNYLIINDKLHIIVCVFKDKRVLVRRVVG